MTCSPFRTSQGSRRESCVLAVGKGGEIDVNDVGLKKSFSLSNAAMDAPTYTDLVMEVMFFLLRTIYHTHRYRDSLTLHPKFSFVHAYYPGFGSLLVSSSGSSSTLLSLFPPLITGLTYPLIVSAEDCGVHVARLNFN